MKKTVMLAAVLLMLAGCKNKTKTLDIKFFENINLEETNSCKFVESVNGKTINESRINGNKIVLIDVTGKTRDIRLECGTAEVETDEETGESQKVIKYTDLDTGEVYRLNLGAVEKEPEIKEEINIEVVKENKEENVENTLEVAEENTKNEEEKPKQEEEKKTVVAEEPKQEQKPANPPVQPAPTDPPVQTPSVPDTYSFYVRGVPDVSEASSQASQGCFDLGYNSVSISAISQEDWEVVCS